MIPDWLVAFDPDAVVTSALHWAAVPAHGLVALAVVAFVAASLVPLSSEAVLIAVLAAQPAQFWPAMAVATLANTAGSLTTYALGRIGRRMPHPPQLDRHVQWFERYGAWVLLLAWVPLVGDMLVVVAGWLRVSLAWSTLAILVGKFGRYLVIAQAWTLLA